MPFQLPAISTFLKDPQLNALNALKTLLQKNPEIIYQPIYESLKSISQIKKNTIVGKAERFKLHALFENLTLLKAKVHNFRQLSNDQKSRQVDSMVDNAINRCWQAFEIPTQIFKQYTKKLDNSFAKETKRNAEIEAKIQEKFTDPKIASQTLLTSALNNAIHFPKNFQISPDTKNHLKSSVGKKQYETLLKKYDLNDKTLDCDGLRMLIIGVVSNMDQALSHSDFMHCLCLVFQETDPTLNSLNSFKHLSESLLRSGIETTALDRIRKKPPEKFLDLAYNYVRSWLPKKMQYFLPERFKANENFKQDLKSATLLANARKWKRAKPVVASKTHAFEQRCASYEYLYHKLAYQNFEDGSIVPVIEPTGSTAYYTVHNLMHKEGIDSMALVPLDTTQNNVDIKVLFRGTHDLGTAVADTEKYGAGYKTYRNNEAEFLSKLNTIVENVKQSGSTKKITFTAGGHSLGGALTQQFAGSMACIKLYPEYLSCKKDITSFRNKLIANIEKQIAHEKKVGHNVDQAFSAEARADDLIKTLEKYHAKHDPIKEQVEARANKKKSKKSFFQLKDNFLRDVGNTQFVTINSPGCGHKNRRRCGDALACASSKAKLSCTNIMVGGDIVQQGGQINISTAIPKAHMLVETMKINSGLEGVNIQSAIKATTIMGLNYLANKVGVLAPIACLLGSQVTLAAAGVTAASVLYKSIENLKKAHCKSHFDDPNKPVDFKRFCNSDNTEQEQVKELGTKIPLVESELYQRGKQYISKGCKKLHALTKKKSTFLNDLQNTLRSNIKRGFKKIISISVNSTQIDSKDAFYTDFSNKFENKKNEQWEFIQPTKADQNFYISPKASDTITRAQQKQNRIKVSYNENKQTVEFQLNSKKPKKETIEIMVKEAFEIMVKKAFECGETLDLDCNQLPILIQALEAIAQYDNQKVNLSARSQVLLSQDATLAKKYQHSSNGPKLTPPSF